MAAALVLLILSGLVVQGQQTPAAPPAPPPSGAISGVVVDGAGGQPLSDIIVQIAGGQLPQDYRTRQVTDSRGQIAPTGVKVSIGETEKRVQDLRIR